MTAEYIFELVQQSILTNQFTQGGIVLAVATWVFYQLKSIPYKIWAQIEKRFVFKVTITKTWNDDTLSRFAEWYALRYPNRFRSIVYSFREKSTRNKEPIETEIQQATDINWIWYKFRLIRINSMREKLEHANDLNALYMQEYHLSGIFAKNAINKLLEEVTSYARSKVKEREGLTMINPGNNTWGDSGTQITVYKKFNRLYFKEKDRLLTFLDNFKEKRQLLVSNGIKPKTGILLEGPPGTGKTSIVQAIADYMHMPIYVFNLAEFATDKEFLKSVHRVESNSIILFEDCDEFLSTDVPNRSQTNAKSKVSFSHLLNILDGVNSPADVIFILTTNHAARLDTAVLRKGRIDLRLEIGHAGVSEITSFLHDFYNTKWKLSMPNNISLPMSTVERCAIVSDDIHTCVSNLIEEFYEISRDSN